MDGFDGAWTDGQSAEESVELAGRAEGQRGRGAVAMLNN